MITFDLHEIILTLHLNQRIAADFHASFLQTTCLPMTLLVRILSLLPLHLLHNLGALLGWIIYFCSPTYRRHMQENLALADVLPVQVRQTAIAEAGKSILELPKIWLRPQAEVVGRVVRVTGWDLVESAWREKDGAILFLTPHLGCFEITAQYYASHRPISVLYRPPKQEFLKPLITVGRGANLKLAAADLGGVRTLMKALKRGEAIGMLPDQVPGNGEGIWVPFFGQPAYTMTLAARLAETGATVLLAYAERLLYGAGYHLKLRSLASPLTGTLGERAAQLNRELEGLIRECPGQYLWGYNRYKVPAGATIPRSQT
ncbi:MAG: lysophospholipid acyltransferase family protein [Sterolibacterium sp.]